MAIFTGTRTVVARCESCGAPVTSARENVFVDGKPVKVGECCFWYFMEN